jgi:heme oxygenase
MTTFSRQLRDATAAAHTAAETQPFVTAMLAGHLDADAVVDLLAAQWVVYTALEQALDACAHPALVPFVDPRLARVPALERDLAHHEGVAWRERVTARLVPAASAYAEDVRAHADDPRCLLAHHYVRYLGDLSGGQVIASLVRRHYGVPEEGLSFYSFPGIRPKPYKDAYRQRLDDVAFDAAERARVVAHACGAFALSRAVFVDLDSRLPAVPVP